MSSDFAELKEKGKEKRKNQKNEAHHILNRITLLRRIFIHLYADLIHLPSRQCDKSKDDHSNHVNK